MGKKVLLVGGGGREHALAWKLCQSPEISELYVAPGNAGTEGLTKVRNVPIKATNILALAAFALKEGIEFTIVGQDDPLALGIVDLFQSHKLRILGPSKMATRIESSKVYSKELMRSVRVPTAPFTVLDNYPNAVVLAQEHFGNKNLRPIVLKASGLALGKGAYVCRSYKEVLHALDELMIQRIHGSAGDKVVAEEFVDGQEISVHALCDGTSYELFPSAQDHKPIYDGDEGPNTGGMGTIAPVPWFNHHDFVRQCIIEPILAGMQRDGHPFVGLLYPGLKMREGWPVVLEFNARFGDPEAQVYMRLWESDLLKTLWACVDGRLRETKIKWNPGYAACITMASARYPSPDYKKGMPITGIDKAQSLPGVVVFHAGTQMVNGQLVTSGGRVLYVTAVGATLKEAIYRAYAGVKCISFEGMQYRKDIGAKSLNK
ncbi:MAG: phosphoribosylamine--glycine ligase [bacterium]|nr:phosphoribosylamine--glycine ligase [bacterium]